MHLAADAPLSGDQMAALLRWRMASMFGWTLDEADVVIANRERMIEFYAYVEGHSKAGYDLDGKRVR